MDFCLNVFREYIIIDFISTSFKNSLKDNYFKMEKEKKIYLIYIYIKYI